MKNKLPKVYQADITHPIINNKTYFYERDLKTIKSNNYKKAIDTDIFTSSRYLYNMPVVLTTNDEVIDTIIIGKVKDKIITKDNRVILLKDIIDIKRKDRM